MKKIVVLFTTFVLLISFIFIQLSFANTVYNEPKDNFEKMYVYERNLVTKETTRIDLSNSNKLKSISSVSKNINMEPYIPSGIEETNESLISPQAIIGPDNRTPVDTSQFPYSCIGYLSIDNGANRGTAFMVDDNIAITAAHCVVGHDYIQFFPGSTLNSHPYGEAWVTSYIWAGGNDYTGDLDFEDDWAILVLDTNIGNNSGWFGVSNMAEYPNGPSGWVGLLANVSGYPGDLGWDQYHAVGNIKTASDKLLTIDTDIMGGNSGSPTYKYNGGYYAYGILVGEHTDYNNSYNSYNFVTRFNDRVYNAIMDAKGRY